MNKLNSIALAFFSLLFISTAFTQTTVDFNADKNSGCGAISNIQFSDQSTGTVTSWYWDFGNGNSSTLQNPVASFSTPGSYTVSLTVTGPNGSLTETKTAFITVFPKPTADFQLSITNGCQPLKVDFTNTSSWGNVPVKEYIWDFGDGSPENNQQNPSYTYQIPGNYIVSLQIIDTNGCTDTKVFNTIDVVQRPQAAFSSYNSADYCSAPHTVNFANYSTGGAGLTYFWDFGDGNISTLKEPVHTYSNMGSYDVTLVAMNNLCADTTKLLDFVSLEPISASFNLSKKEFCYGDTIDFEAVTTGAASYHWDFGDGTTSSLKTPYKIYLDSGYFSVKLTAKSGPSCIASFIDTIYIQKVIADFYVLEDTMCSQGITYIDNSLYGNLSIWKMQNGKTVNTLEDTSIIAVPGFGHFDDSLIAISKLGCRDTLFKEDHLFIYDDRPQIMAFNIDYCIPDTIDFKYKLKHHFDSVIDVKWTFNNQSFNTDSATFIFTTADTHVVFLEITNSRGCSSIDTFTVYTGDKHPFTDNFPDTICAGDSLHIEKPFPGLTDADYSILIAYAKTFKDITSFNEIGYEDDKVAYIPSDTGWLFIKHLINDHGCITFNLDSVYIKGPIANFFPQPINCGNPLTFQFNSTFIDADRFYWDFGDGSPLDSISTNPNHTYTSNGMFVVTLTVFNSNTSCSFTVQRPVSTLPPPTASIIFLNSPPLHSCTYDTLYFQASGTYSSDQKWLVQDTLYSDSTHIFLTSKDVDSIKIQLITNNEYGCTDTVTEVIEFIKPTADFSSNFSGGCPPFKVQLYDRSKFDDLYGKATWRWDIKHFGVDSFHFNPILNIDTSMVVNVTLSVMDSLGCKDTISMDSVIVTEFNTLNFWAAQRYACEGDTIYFDNFSKILDSSYTWYFGDGDSLRSIDAFHTYDQAGAFDIELRYVNEFGCDTSLIFKDYVVIQDKPVADFTADVTFSSCYPLPVTFQDLSNNPDIKSWQWEFGDGVSSIFQHPFHNYTSVGKFDVSLIIETTNGCSDTIIKPEYIQTNGPTAEFSISPDTGCIYDYFNFDIIKLTGAASFQWDFGDGNFSLDMNTNHKYDEIGKKYTFLYISDSTGFCTVPIKDSVYVVETKAIFDVSDLEICLGESIDFQDNSIGANQLEWEFGDGSTSTISNPTHIYTSPGTYQVKLKIIGMNNCEDDSIQTIVVNAAPQLEATVDTSICFGDSIQLNSGGGTLFTWTPTESLNDPSIPNPIAFPDTFTSYKVVVENQFGCKDSSKVNVQVHFPPAHSIFEDTTLIIGESIFIHAADNPGFIYTWKPDLWLNCRNCQTPLAQPLKSTTYVLNTHDAFGCFSIFDSIHIEVKEAYSVNVPNAFSPNGDRNNDIIYVRGWGIKDLLEFKIYNRWGELVFESSDLSKGWDGFYKEELQNVDTYVYTVKALMWNQEVWTDKGNISLLR